MTIVQFDSVTKEFFVKQGNKNNNSLWNFFRYKKEVKKAIDNVTFAIAKSERVGLIGLNGSGKSTTIKLMTGILSPTAGNVTLFNKNPIKDRKHTTKRFGVMFGQRSLLWYHLPVAKSLLLYKDIYNVKNKDFEERIEWFNEVLELKEFLNQPVRTLSLGQRIRCEIAASMIHSPELLILDEPFIGLDFMVKNKIRRFLLELNRQENVTIIIADHDLLGLEEICNRLLLLHKGRIIDDIPLNTFKEKVKSFKRIEFSNGHLSVDKISVSFPIELSETVGNTTRLTIDTDKVNPTEILSFLEKQNISTIQVTNATLQDNLRIIYFNKGEVS